VPFGSRKARAPSKVSGCDIRPAAQAEFVRGFGVRDRMSRRKGALISIHMRNSSETEAVAVGEWLQGGAVGFEYTLVKDPTWRVDSVTKRYVVDY